MQGFLTLHTADAARARAGALGCQTASRTLPAGILEQHSCLLLGLGEKKKKTNQKPTSKLMSTQFVCAESLVRQVCAQRPSLERKVPQRQGRADEEEEHGNAGHWSCAPPGCGFANLGVFLANLLHSSTLTTDRVRRRSRRPHRSSLLLKK